MKSIAVILLGILFLRLSYSLPVIAKREDPSQVMQVSLRTASTDSAPLQITTDPSIETLTKTRQQTPSTTSIASHKPKSSNRKSNSSTSTISLSASQLAELQSHGQIFEYLGTLAYKNSTGYYFLNGTMLNPNTSGSTALISSMSADEAMDLAEQAQQKYLQRQFYDIDEPNKFTDLSQLRIFIR